MKEIKYKFLDEISKLNNVFACRYLVGFHFFFTKIEGKKKPIHAFLSQESCVKVERPVELSLISLFKPVELVEQLKA